MKREEMPWLKAFLHDDFVNEHSVGSSLKLGWKTISRSGRIQALTVKEEVRFGRLQLGGHHGNQSSRPLLLLQGIGGFFVFL